MANFYLIAGRKIPTYKISMAFLGLYSGLAYYATRPKKQDFSVPPPITSSSDDELKFIEEFIAAAEKEDAAH
ncbi:hypothetical protein BB560_005974 [Smittium megazygosporum]|uniref:ATP synthase subunit K, mitochondrial n=1 Tax=Smittium megazygosporum TaxID=133381 RepID=A0A2T9YNR3_9FUNG|nr:hypothetical protein BB560_005974 [Smittium megazygosporum]